MALRIKKVYSEYAADIAEVLLSKTERELIMKNNDNQNVKHGAESHLPKNFSEIIKTDDPIPTKVYFDKTPEEILNVLDRENYDVSANISITRTDDKMTFKVLLVIICDLKKLSPKRASADEPVPPFKYNLHMDFSAIKTTEQAIKDKYSRLMDEHDIILK
ncbi:hypothetical protein [Lacticaseibacillus paracasei]|uniref:hypothetical protein n=2 Tax=Lacticaseibacillus paracasei TaxID=1597 RepID=UPI0022DF2FEA|nr:hypothetical protein [Lacticaseibacillus paracasei]